MKNGRFSHSDVPIKTLYRRLNISIYSRTATPGKVVQFV